MPSCPGGVRRVVWGYRNEEDEMNFELLIGMGTLVMGFGIIVYGAIAREHPLLCLFGLGVAALGASQAVVQVVPRDQRDLVSGVSSRSPGCWLSFLCGEWPAT